MNKIFLLISMLISISVFAQSPNWTGVKETNINISNAINHGIDIFTNRAGNHIIVQEGNNLKYYRMNLNGYSEFQKINLRFMN